MLTCLEYICIKSTQVCTDRRLSLCHRVNLGSIQLNHNRSELKLNHFNMKGQYFFKKNIILCEDNEIINGQKK